MSIREFGVELIRNLTVPGIIGGAVYEQLAKAANPNQYLGAGTGNLEFAGEIATHRETVLEPRAAQPDAASVALPAMDGLADKLIAAAERLGELRAGGLNEEGKFFPQTLPREQRAEMQDIQAQVAVMSRDAGVDGLRGQVEELSRLIAAASPEAAAAADGIRQALATSGQRGGEELKQGVQQGVAGSLATLAGVGARFFSAGSQIAGQLAAGIRSNMGAVDAAANAMVDRVAAKVPQSPAREGPLRGLPYAGAEIVRQLAAGMGATGPVDSAAARVAASIASMTADAPLASETVNVGAPRGARAAPGNGSGGGMTVQLGGVTIHAGDKDPQAIAQEVIQAIEDRLLAGIATKYGDVI